MRSPARHLAQALAALALLVPFAAHAATLSLSPSNISVTTGSTFTEVVVVSSSDQALNAISGMLSFPKNLLQAVSVSKANSILSLWVADPSISNADGTVSFSGIVPNPGFLGGSGRVFSVQFRAKASGTATITFSSSSQVLANDGNGTDILTDTPPATVTIAEAPASTPAPAATPAAPSVDLLARITSSTHPDQTRWYTLSHASFDWTNDLSATATRVSYDQDANGTPSISTAPVSHEDLNLTDGIWYLHVEEKGAKSWGAVSTYKVQIDTVAPLAFSISFPNGTSTIPFGATEPIEFATTDALSGIDHYDLDIDGKTTTLSADQGSQPYALGGSSGQHTLIVTAYDKAGNKTSAQTKFSVAGGTPSAFGLGWIAINYLSLGLIALAVLTLILFGIWYAHAHFSAYRHRLNHRLGNTHARVHKEFDTLKEAITQEVLSLEEVKSTRALTKEEARLIAKFRKLLEKSEAAIDRDIEEIQ